MDPSDSVKLFLAAAAAGGLIFGLLKWRARRRLRSTLTQHEQMLAGAATASKTVKARQVAATARAGTTTP